MQLSIMVFSVFTSLDNLPQIIGTAPSIMNGVSAFWIQVFHDYLTIMLVYMALQSQYHLCIRKQLLVDDVRLVTRLNIVHGMVMTSFAYYKRCILTLWYNRLLAIDACHRYIPIWQRLINYILNDPFFCLSDQYQDFHYTYIWLNNHILFSIIVCMINMTMYLRLSKQRLHTV